MIVRLMGGRYNAHEYRTGTAAAVYRDTGISARYSAGNPKALPQSLAKMMARESSSHAGAQLLQFAAVSGFASFVARLCSQIL